MEKKIGEFEELTVQRQSIHDVSPQTPHKAIARSYGLRPVIHPHTGGYIEFSDEIEQVMAHLSAEEAGLCLDTGHLYYAGMNPATAITQYAKRLEYVHFKDINPDVFQNVLAQQLPFFDACAQQVMCPIGTGTLNYTEILAALQQIEYDGIITIEQERHPLQFSLAYDDVCTSFQYLQTLVESSEVRSSIF